MTTATLYGLAYSPFTERARWALDHHRVPYDYHEHLPMLGEPLLRRKARAAGREKATVPLFVHAHGVIGDSFEIINYADQEGSGRKLGAGSAEARAWLERVNVALDAVRTRVLQRLLDDPAALDEHSMGLSPKALAPLMRPLTARVVRFLTKKHGATMDTEHARQQIRDLCLHLRESLANGSLQRERLDAQGLLAATFLAGVKPVATSRLTAGQRRVWTEPVLADEFADLLTWRDGLYAAFR
ncbi:MAG: glutathione S-transferase N-terminal domain-containing protein [Polyangiaceae bacterium]|nr:glutathione S-transferase N-terminal domain-containing protein [Polyangiaceae bacterium]MCW5789747.1 glutathione S-transferase N-terminal domain-containing protein [Polyangiaceae bacterium]